MATRHSYPAYCLHRATNQSYSTIREPGGRKVHYFGEYGSDDSLQKYADLLRSLKFETCTVTEAVIRAKTALESIIKPQQTKVSSGTSNSVYGLYNAFMDWARNHYKLPSGDVSREVENFRHSFVDFLDLHGSRAVSTLTRADLTTARQKMIDRKLSRGVINQRIGRIVRVFVWGGDDGRELVPDSVAAAFKLVKPLKAFRDGVRETTAVEAVPVEDLKKVLEIAHPVLKTMLTLQLLTGCRPGEVRVLKRRMIKERDGVTVIDFGTAHKTAYKGKKRIVPLGPQAIELLQPWIANCHSDEDCLFRPELAPKTTRRTLKTYYTKDAYILALTRACIKAKIPPFGPNRVRHLAATEIRREYGLEAAQAVLGHSHYTTTERYASPVSDLAKKVADKRG